jgi:glycosyltransferase involved in cell wall biosynthesis
MKTIPILNDSTNPMVSVLIYNYDGQYLKECLDRILNQEILTNLEIILIDDATDDDSWDTAVEYSGNHPGVMTISRNKRFLGPIYNEKHCLRMAKGRYCALLKNDQAFLPEYIKSCLLTLKTDPYARFDTVRRNPQLPVEPPSILHAPLVSILCYNFNYGRYLRQCLESIFAQTYENIELCFSDNASSDESWSIALEFSKKYPGKMRLTRNRINYGSGFNFENCKYMMLGKYFINFCSDDVLVPEYVEQCVNVLEANPNVGLVIVNRAVIDENGLRTDEAPFYKQSCIIPGEEQAAVYMMAGVNPSVSQIMYRNDIVDRRYATGALGSRYYGTRILDFNISTDFDIAYLKDSLLLHRIHSQSDTSQADSNLLPVIGLYVLNHQFADIASLRNLRKVSGRLPLSIEKLARLAIRYSVRSLLAKDEQTAQRYFYLAQAMSPQLGDDLTWKKLQEYWMTDSLRKKSILSELENSKNLATRSVSYDPPAGSLPLLAASQHLSPYWERMVA